MSTGFDFFFLCDIWAVFMVLCLPWRGEQSEFLAWSLLDMMMLAAVVAGLWAISPRKINVEASLAALAIACLRFTIRWKVYKERQKKAAESSRESSNAAVGGQAKNGQE
ncbi:hypothetical protein [Paracidobacterium acidisoli]|uniref:Uncharacterized protein n=1 Tax=Paracidobacterium acidisoli TaxID=2303751 RepID=A0A372IM42_9BACT|nr:hypothetical protein [Paracidobacterium acidisoli]MBT9331620.1 hypothetical protein [Paracidobacterium acidisoli]